MAYQEAKRDSPPNCNVCQEINGEYNGFQNKQYQDLIKSKKNVVLFTDNFSVIPSVGALNKTHVLIVPSHHARSFAELSEKLLSELLELKTTISNYCQSSNIDIVFFEHGTGSESDGSGSCVDHAHLHCVARVNGLELALQERLNLVKIPAGISINKLGNKKDGHLFFEDCSGSSFINNQPKTSSQIFRKIYSELDPSVEVWNWRSHFNLKAIRQAIDFYKDIAHKTK
jgi:ATP adenylyltransferase